MDTPETIIRHVSLCSGYGGIDLGLKRVLPTCRTIAYVEIEAFACANLVAKMEAGELDAAPIWTNLKTLPHEVFQSGVEIISGGFPCQPFSSAGAHKSDQDPRHLFPYIKNAIRTIRPQLVFLENVQGIISSKLKTDNWADPEGTPVLLHVLRELEREGYQCAWGVFSAAECGAPHQRKRVFILGRLANAGSEGLEGVRKCDSAEGRETSKGYPRSSGALWPARPGEPQQEWEEPRVVADTKEHDRRHMQERSETLRSEQQSRRQIKSELGRATDGTAGGLDATANRIDRLRLLGNGVVPATCEVAFRTLYADLTNQERKNTNDNNWNNQQ